MEKGIITNEEFQIVKGLIEKIIRDAVAPEISRQVEASKNIILERINDLVSKVNPVYYTREEVCTRLNICKATFHNWVAEGKIKPVKMGGRVYVEPSELDRVMNEVSSCSLKVNGRNKRN